MKAPVSVLVLTRNEEVNIAACLESVTWAREVFVVDSFSDDRTVAIAEGMGAKVYQHAFETCERQWNWALDNLAFSCEWILVLDADECIPQDTAEEIIRNLGDPSLTCTGYWMKRRLYFLGKWLKHGGIYPTWILRLFKRNAGRFGRHGISEHLMLQGQTGYLQAAFDHRDNKPLSYWIQRHNRYAELEAEEFVIGTLGKSHARSIAGRFWGNQAERKQWIKLKIWNRLPLLGRPALFFVRNYFLKLGFLDGRAGLIYHVLWSFWYPFLISAKILEKQATTRQPASVHVAPEAMPLAAVTGAGQEQHN